MANILKNKKNLPKKSRDDHAEDALYREVWEEVNAQKMYTFMKKHAKYLLTGAAIVMIVVTTFQVSKYNHKKHVKKVAEVYETAIKQNNIQALRELAKTADNGTGDLAAFKTYIKTQDVKILENLADNGATRDFRDLARMHLAGINGDKMSADDFADFMDPLDTKKSPYYYNAALLVAQKYLSVGDKKNADKYLKKIDSDAPNTISATAQSLK